MRRGVVLVISLLAVGGVNSDPIEDFVDVVAPEIVRNDIKRARSGAQQIVDVAAEPFVNAANLARESISSNVVASVDSNEGVQFDLGDQFNRITRDRPTFAESFEAFAENSKNLHSAAQDALKRERLFNDMTETEKRLSLTLEHVRSRRDNDDDDAPTEIPQRILAGRHRGMQANNYGPLLSIIMSMRNQWTELSSFDTFQEIQSSFDYLRSNGIQPQLAELDLSPSAREFFDISSAFLATLPFSDTQGARRVRVDENLASFLDRTVSLRTAPDFEDQLLEIADQLQTFIDVVDGTDTVKHPREDPPAKEPPSAP